MKKLIFMFLVITSPIFAQWDYLPNRPERTSYFGDDLVVMLWDSSGTPTWRYTLFSTFFSAIEDTADLYYPVDRQYRQVEKGAQRRLHQCPGPRSH